MAVDDRAYIRPLAIDRAMDEALIVVLQLGIGIDRLTMARYGIDDIRLLYANEESFLAQF